MRYVIPILIFLVILGFTFSAFASPKGNSLAEMAKLKNVPTFYHLNSVSD